MKRNKERKNSIFDETRKEPEMDFQARLAMLGAAKYKK
jgi:hypothetical protein